MSRATNTIINTVRRVPLSSARKTIDLITDVYHVHYPGKAAVFTTPKFITASLVIFCHLFSHEKEGNAEIFLHGIS